MHSNLSIWRQHFHINICTFFPLIWSCVEISVKQISNHSNQNCQIAMRCISMSTRVYFTTSNSWLYPTPRNIMRQVDKPIPNLNTIKNSNKSVLRYFSYFVLKTLQTFIFTYPRLDLILSLLVISLRLFVFHSFFIQLSYSWQNKYLYCKKSKDIIS